MSSSKLVSIEDTDTGLVWFVYATGRRNVTGGVHLPNPTMELSREDMRFFPRILEEARKQGLKLVD